MQMDIQLKCKENIDSEFCSLLFGIIKAAELNAEEWPEHTKKILITLQYNAFENTIRNEYPDADDFVIIVDSENAGRLQLDINENRIKVINISLLPAFQKIGVGSKIMKDILTEADNKKKPVYLEVDKVNPAFHLYKKLGFEVYNEEEIRYSMKYLPGVI